MNEVVRQTQNTLSGKVAYAQTLAAASLLPKSYKDNPGNVLLAMELGDALGISPIQAITAVHVIEGKPSASADLIGSLVRKAGHRLRVTGDDKQATAIVIRADDPDFPFEATWDIAKAQKAGLTGKDVWKKYPAAMLKARAITEACRAGASDALYGVVYTPEELGAEVDGDGAPLPSRSASAPAKPTSRVAQAMAAAAQPEPEPLADLGERPARDFLAEAELAEGDPTLLRALWTAAQKAGEPQSHLDTIFAMATPVADEAPQS